MAGAASRARATQPSTPPSKWSAKLAKSMVKTSLTKASSAARLSGSLLQTPPKLRSSPSSASAFSGGLAKKRPAAARCAPSPTTSSRQSPRKEEQPDPNFDVEAAAGSWFSGDHEHSDRNDRNDIGAFAARARLDAVLLARPRILSLQLLSPAASRKPGPALPVLLVTYRAESRKEMQDRVQVLGLPEVLALLAAIGRRSTTRSRRSASVPALSAEAVAARSPSLWWSLVLMVLGWQKESGVDWQPDELPIVVRTDIQGLLDHLVEAVALESPTA